MNFLIFRIFSRFFLFILRFLMLKIRFKNVKMFIFLRGTHVDATWHSGPRGNATRAHTAPTRRVIYIIFT